MGGACVHAVTACAAGGPATEARLQVGDVIHGAHSYALRDAAELGAILHSVPGPLEVFYVRPGNTTKQQCVLYRV
jgi:hypothetical protein